MPHSVTGTRGGVGTCFDPLEENPEEVAGEGDPQAPQDPQDDAPQLYRQVLQGFRTVAQTFSAAYGNAHANIQQVIRRSLRECTNDDRTFIYGASNAIRLWVESVCTAMAGAETGKDSTEVGKDTKVTKDQTQLLADALMQAGCHRHCSGSNTGGRAQTPTGIPKD